MKKATKILLVLTFLIFIVLSNTRTVNAALVIPELFKKINDTYIRFKDTTLEFGATGARIAKGWFTALDTTSITIGGASEGAFVIDVTDSEAFLVRRDSDAGDLFNINTTDFDIDIFGLANFSSPTVTSTLAFFDQNYDHKTIDIDSEATSATGIDADFQNTSGDLMQLSVNTAEKFAIDYTGAVTANSLTLTTDLAFGDGGTGISSWTQYLIPYAATTTSIGQIAIGNSGEVLTSNGAGSAPTFQATAGDVTGVGDCASGACLDGSSDGGSYIRLYDGDSHYLELNPGNIAANRIVVFRDAAGTVLLSGDTLTGDITATFDSDGGTATAIGAGVIIETDLDGDVAPVDGDFLQYDSTGTNFTWRSGAETLSDIGAEVDLVNEAGLYAVLSDVTNFLQTGDALAGDDITDGSVDASEIGDNTIDFAEILFSNTLAGNPALAVDECFLLSTTTGGGFICEGSTANTNEQLYIFPDVDGVDTTNRIVVDATQVTDIEGTGLSITTNTLNWSASGIAGHDTFTDFVAAEHVDWAGASAGTIHTDNYIENVTHTGDVTGSGSLAIASGVIVEDDLNADEVAADNDILTFDTTGANFSWQTPAELSLQPLHASLTSISGLTEAAGVLIYGTADNAYAALAAGATTEILVGGGAAAPVWTTATGSGAPARATSPTFVTPTLGVASGTSLDVSGILEAGSSNITLTTSTGLLKHEAGGIEADISAIVKGGLLVGTGTNTIGIKTVGTNNQVLTADSAQAGGVKWATAAGGGDVSKVGTPVDSQIGVWTGDGTIEGTTDFTFDGADFIFYHASNDGNPEIRLGSADANELHIQTVYDTGAQTLDYVVISTESGTEGDLALNTSGNVGVNVTDPDTRLEIMQAGNQLKLSYDGTDNTVFAVDTSGDLTITPSGTQIIVPDNVSIKSQNELRFYDNGNYVGFEAPALSADQIWVLPTADGSASQYLQTDGSGTLSWAAAGGGGSTMDFCTFFEAVASANTHLYTLTVNTGSISMGSGGVTFGTGATASSEVKMRTDMRGNSTNTFALDPEWSMQLRPYPTKGTESQMYLGIGFVYGSSHNYVQDQAGFKFDVTTSTLTMFATNSQGTTETTTDLSAYVTAGSDLMIRLNVDDGTNIKYYVSGTLRATHSTNLPDAAVSSSFNISINNKTAASTSNTIFQGGCLKYTTGI